MNIFFYTTSRSDAAKHYMKRLQEFSVLTDMTILPAGVLFLSPLTLKLRSGDLLLLFVTDTEEFKELSTLRNEFSNFRVILILPDSTLLRDAYALFQPRFIAFHDEEMIKIEAVIKKTRESLMLPN